MGTKNILNKFKKHSVSFDVTETHFEIKTPEKLIKTNSNNETATTTVKEVYQT